MFLLPDGHLTVSIGLCSWVAYISPFIEFRWAGDEVKLDGKSKLSVQAWCLSGTVESSQDCT